MAKFPTYEEMGKKVAEEALDGYIYKGKTLREWIDILKQTRWVPCSERLPKENEYIKNVCKYYLIQDEYGDMHVAHLSNVGWIPMDSLKAIGVEIIAWRELPLPYKEEQDVCKDCYYNDGEVHAECVICDKAESEDEE